MNLSENWLVLEGERPREPKSAQNCSGHDLEPCNIVENETDCDKLNIIMAEKDNNKDAADYGIGVPVKKHGFFLEGLDHVDWGMKDRLSRIFNPKSGHTVMLAFDHGYIMGPTSGLERMDLTITPLIEYADCLMCSRGALRSIAPDVEQGRIPALFGGDHRADRTERRVPAGH